MRRPQPPTLVGDTRAPTSLKEARTPLPSLRAIGLRHLDSKAPCGVPANLAEGRPRPNDGIVRPFHECATSHPRLPISSVSGDAAPGRGWREAGKRYWIRQP